MSLLNFKEVQVQGLNLRVRELSLAEYDLIEGVMDGRAMARLITACVENKDASPFVTLEDAERLPIRIVTALTSEIMAVSGLGVDEDLTGKSEGVTSGDSDSC
jgi:hypothetical protein